MRMLKSQTLAAIPLSGHMGIFHMPIGMGGTDLVAAAPYPGKETQVSCKGQQNASF